jgi:hypothetical protein
MFSQSNAQSNVTTSLFTLTPASIGSQRIQTLNPAKSSKFGAVPIKPAVRMSAAGIDSSESAKLP